MNYPGDDVARAACDVTERRGWSVVCRDGLWSARVLLPGTDQETLIGLKEDPFTALVEADRWYKENVEKETAVQ